MTISSRVHQEFYEQAHPLAQAQHVSQQLIRIPPSNRKFKSAKANSGAASPSSSSSDSEMSSVSDVDSRFMASSTAQNGTWSAAEHERFLEAIERFPRGPWKSIAAYIGNKTARQVMSHAQKYRQKIARRKRGLQLSRRKCKTAEGKKTSSKSDLTKSNKQSHSELQVDTLASPQRDDVHRPESPTEVSVPVSVSLDGLEWTSVHNDHMMASPEYVHQHLLTLPHHEQYPHQLRHLQHHVAQHPIGMTHYHHQPVQHFVGSYVDLLQHKEDVQVIINSVGDFVDNFKVDQLLSHSTISGDFLFHDHDLDRLLHGNSSAEQLIV